jgi:hypothetical protein
MRSIISFICSAVYFVGFIFNLMVAGKAMLASSWTFRATEPRRYLLQVRNCQSGSRGNIEIENSDRLPAATRTALGMNAMERRWDVCGPFFLPALAGSRLRRSNATKIL